ncbi:uncharacterized protein ASCRUDRAFT_5407 [Ascoidea rubescens DSM 1968]|uniref:Arrestin-like N-terminal domain-containing protein n=1 Tax=Ascoidea rubescens DSM 1968 TaxID=1344418 RepID=A0A1D2VP63_9ASCO|nr:hypothetical protein ASCRUDRAFT_5407 [Ascoidea rubescens DSM 1968]ODV63412.1 hypothetical protein ASCRUDRAFT_5407 [Ascoidea rubescens DSM 1968]
MFSDHAVLIELDDSIGSYSNDASTLMKCYSNLEDISGQVKLNIKKKIIINSIIIKLVGISKVSIKKLGNDLNFHHNDFKFLDVRKNIYIKTKSTFKPGEYNYDFQFDSIPYDLSHNINNHKNSFEVFNADFNPFYFANNHRENITLIKKRFVLPPSTYKTTILNSFTNGSFKIYYYLECIVNRPIYTLNLKFKKNIWFLPMSSSLSPLKNLQLKKFEYNNINPNSDLNITIPKTVSQNVALNNVCHLNNNFSFDFAIKFKNDPILTINEKLPFELYLIFKDPPNHYSSFGLQKIFLKSFEIKLIVYTFLKGNDFSRSFRENLKLISFANNHHIKLNINKCTRYKETNSYYLRVPKYLYKNFILPRSIIPTFSLNNISRKYELVVSSTYFVGTGPHSSPKLTQHIYIINNANSYKNLTIESYSNNNHCVDYNSPTQRNIFNNSNRSAFAINPANGLAITPPPTYEEAVSNI